jgi:site-specific DNA recombinase
VGDLVWNRQRHGKGKGLKPAEAWVTVKDAWPAILDRETFARVQEVLAIRAPTEDHRRSPSSDYLLTGLLVCGQCGAGYTVEQAKNGRYRYYQCGRTMKEGTAACPGWRIPLARADRAALEGILDSLFDERELGRIAAWAAKEAGVDPKSLEKQERELNRWETDIASRRERLLGALETGKIDAGVLTPRLARLDEERGKLAEKRLELDRVKPKAVAVPSVEMFREYGQALRRKYDTGPVQSTKLLLRRFVRRILADKGALKAELVIGKPRQHGGSDDEFALSDGWWS